MNIIYCYSHLHYNKSQATTFAKVETTNFHLIRGNKRSTFLDFDFPRSPDSFVSTYKIFETQPPRESAPPLPGRRPLRESWIRHCLPLTPPLNRGSGPGIGKLYSDNDDTWCYVKFISSQVEYNKHARWHYCVR